MSLQWKVAMPLRSAWTLILPSGERRSTRRRVMDTISIEPSGIQPRPDGASSISNSTRTSPSGDTDLTALAKKSLNQPPARTLAEIEPSAQHARVLGHRFLPYSSRPNSVSSRSHDSCRRARPLWLAATQDFVQD